MDTLATNTTITADASVFNRERERLID